MPFVILFFLSLTSHALVLKGSEGKVYEFSQIQKSRVSSHCQKECLALKDYSLKIKDFQRRGGNPASEFCQHIGGNDLIASHPNLDQDSICLFRDGSYILSWDLYRRNQKAQK